MLVPCDGDAQVLGGCHRTQSNTIPRVLVVDASFFPIESDDLAFWGCLVPSCSLKPSCLVHLELLEGHLHFVVSGWSDT